MIVPFLFFFSGFKPVKSCLRPHSQHFTPLHPTRNRAGERPGDRGVLLPAEDCVCGDGRRGQPVLEYRPEEAT